jgi:hypothetical protein
MTEADWWAATDPDRLIDWLFFDARAADRKLRLFSVACCESLRHHVRDPGVLAALGLAEAFADGRIDAAALATAHTAAWGNFHARHSRYDVSPAEVSGAEAVCLYPTAQDPHRDRDRYREDDDAPYALLIAYFIDHPRAKAHFPRLVRLLHDVFGPLPFREVAVGPGWLTSDVVSLARGIYDEKAFDRMPILADALQDAGCDNDEVLTHCRREGWEHVRGCWVIDLLLGRPWRESS